MFEKFLIAIYHKDRIDYLKNLLKSFEKKIHLKKFRFDVIIFDNSSNPNSIQYLQKIKKHKVIFSKLIKFDTLGTLYQSMNQTLDICIAQKYKYFFTIQDDMQLIRKLDDNDIILLKKIVNSQKKILCCNLSFFRKINCLDFKKISLNKNKYFYINHLMSYCDTAFFSTKYLKNKKFNFIHGEDKLDRLYKKKGYKVAHLFYPIFHHLPWGDTARITKFDEIPFIAKIKKILIFINKLGTGSKLNKIRLKNKNFFYTRNIEILPTDELFLTTNDKLLTPWAYDPIWSFLKIKKIKNFFLLDWIFNGSNDYIEMKKKIKNQNLLKTKIFYAKNQKN